MKATLFYLFPGKIRLTGKFAMLYEYVKLQVLIPIEMLIH